MAGVPYNNNQIQALSSESAGIGSGPKTNNGGLDKIITKNKVLDECVEFGVNISIDSYMLEEHPDLYQESIRNMSSQLANELIKSNLIYVDSESDITGHRKLIRGQIRILKPDTKYKYNTVPFETAISSGALDAAQQKKKNIEAQTEKLIKEKVEELTQMKKRVEALRKKEERCTIIIEIDLLKKSIGYLEKEAKEAQYTLQNKSITKIIKGFRSKIQSLQNRLRELDKDNLEKPKSLKENKENKRVVEQNIRNAMDKMRQPYKYRTIKTNYNQLWYSE